MNSPMPHTCAENECLIRALLKPGSLVYLVGIGGCGMSGLAHLLIDFGCIVEGADAEYSGYVAGLKTRGINISIGHSVDNISRFQPQLVVRSSAVSFDNCELQWAQDNDIPVVGRAWLLNELTRQLDRICIAGMHGKTTTTAMMAFVLTRMGFDVGYALGGNAFQLQPHAKMPHGSKIAFLPNAGVDTFVVETDESDGSLCLFKPAHAILLNIDREHLDYFSGMPAILEEFERFSCQVSGYIVYCADDEHLTGLIKGRPKTYSYGFSEKSDFQIKLCQPLEALAANTQYFQLAWGERDLGLFCIGLTGEHNVLNAASVTALLTLLGIEPGKISATLREFRGVARRQQLLYHDHNCSVWDDYGHHPKEIAATLHAIKPACPKRLLTVFQPHRFTRTQMLWNEFSTAFHDSDVVWLTDIYSANEKPIEGVTGYSLTEALKTNHSCAYFEPDESSLFNALQTEAIRGTHLLFIGAGNISNAAHRFVDRLKARREKSRQVVMERLLEAAGSAGLVRRDEPLAKHTTWRVGGAADFYVEPDSEKSLSAVLRLCKELTLPFFIIGRGSNLLVRDGGYRGVVISLFHGSFCRISVDREKIHCGAGARLRDVVMEARRHQLSGFEFLEGVPGSVGGALRMNAGAMQHSVFDIVDQVRCMDFEGRIHEWPAAQIPVNYRSCPMLNDQIALGAVFCGKPASLGQIDEKLNEYNQKRWKTQPAAPSAGCVFKNPDSSSAGRIIDELGLKGWRVGGAVVSDKHANFFVNNGGATARDIAILIDRVRLEVYRARKIWLQTEIQIIGEAEPPICPDCTKEGV